MNFFNKEWENYKNKLELSSSDLSYLDKIKVPLNKFSKIPQAGIETIKTYLYFIKRIDIYLLRFHTSVREIINKYDKGGIFSHYKSIELLNLIYKLAEEYVRSEYKYGSSFHFDRTLRNISELLQLTRNLSIDILLEHGESIVAKPLKETIEELSKMFPSYWKHILHELNNGNNTIDTIADFIDSKKYEQKTIYPMGSVGWSRFRKERNLSNIKLRLEENSDIIDISKTTTPPINKKSVFFHSHFTKKEDKITLKSEILSNCPIDISHLLPDSRVAPTVSRYSPDPIDMFGENILDSSNNTYYSYWHESQKRLQLLPIDLYYLKLIWVPENKFIKIPQCTDEIISFFLHLITAIDFILTPHHLSIKIIIDRMNKAEENTRRMYFWPHHAKQFLYAIFRLAEEVVQKEFQFKTSQKIDGFIMQIKNDIGVEFDLPLLEIVNKERERINTPTHETEIELCALNSTFWKKDLKELAIELKKEGYSEKIHQNVLHVLSINQKNEMLDKMFYELAKILSGYNIQQSLYAYVSYCNYSLAKKNPCMPMQKISLKNIFGHDREKLSTFEAIIERYKIQRNEVSTRQELDGIFSIQKKKINITVDEILKIEALHTVTLQSLNEILNDEKEEIELKMNSNVKNKMIEEKSQLPILLELNSVQIAFLTTFFKNKNRLTNEKVISFAQKHKTFKNQLVNSINEKFYESFEDNIIEEESNEFFINEYYLSHITSVVKTNE